MPSFVLKLFQFNFIRTVSNHRTVASRHFVKLPSLAFFIYSTKEMGIHYVFLWQGAINRPPKVKISSLLYYYDTTMVHPLRQVPFSASVTHRWMLSCLTKTAANCKTATKKHSCENGQVLGLDWKRTKKQPLSKKHWKTFRKPVEAFLKTTFKVE